MFSHRVFNQSSSGFQSRLSIQSIIFKVLRLQWNAFCTKVPPQLRWKFTKNQLIENVERINHYLAIKGIVKFWTTQSRRVLKEYRFMVHHPSKVIDQILSNLMNIQDKFFDICSHNTQAYETSAAIRAWNIPFLQETMTDRPTDGQTGSYGS